jgi:hypothetical protein
MTESFLVCLSVCRACASGGNATTANGYECAVLPDYQTSCDRSRAGGVMCTETQTITQDGTTFTFKRPRCFSNMCNNNNAIGDYEYFATKHTRAWCDTNGYTGCSVDYECPASGPPVILIIGIVIVVGVVVIAGSTVFIIHSQTWTGEVLTFVFSFRSCYEAARPPAKHYRKCQAY